jgi:6-phosphofructokinase 2
MTGFTRIAGETRTNLILKEETTGQQYLISASGPEISPTEIGQFYQQIRQIQDMTYLVLSGSLPKGVTPNLYGQLILAGREKGAFVLLDADGRALRESIAFQPSCIKPNQYELSRLAGREIHSESDILRACDEIHGQGIPCILVSRGRDGLIFSKGDRKIKAVAPPVNVDSTVGAGDSAVAGFILSHARGQNETDWVRWACASGTATAQTPGTELCHLETVEEILPRVEITEL